MKRNTRAFTLIELLVVVLIVGILAAVALPQYQKAVLKSRYIQAMTMAEAIYRAEQVYFLANGKYTQDLSALDIEIPGIYDTKWAKGSSYNCDVNVGGNLDEVYCRLIPESHVGIHYFFSSGIRYCWMDEGEDKSNLWYQLCKSLTGNEGTTWFGNKKYFTFDN
ncbi:MAG: prepilin-type N-terminal cleavage/methylation domain-containing protein [Elusimicrobiaceae bacterium]|nr:prepilin-type N-terminal cleavage/methylation domain-containing protein [Elusimicrobiaceae bacterium]